MRVQRDPSTTSPLDDARGWLVDLYDTVIAVDFVAVYSELAQSAEIPYEQFVSRCRWFQSALTLGAVTWSTVLADVLLTSGRPAGAVRVDELLAARRSLLVEHSRVFPDAVDLLERLRECGAATALVSNSDDHARRLLEQLGVDRLVDHVVLSCEVGSAKPEAGIYRAALRVLDCPPDGAVMVDDQAMFSSGAAALGIRAIQVHREPLAIVGDGGFDRSRDWSHTEDLREVGPRRLAARGARSAL